MLVRVGAAVVAMEAVALAVALLAFGWPVLLVGAPLLLGTVILFTGVGISERPRRALREHRVARWNPDDAAAGGLMSGFFDPARR